MKLSLRFPSVGPSVGTADLKSMSYLTPSLGRSEVDELFPGLNGQFEVDVLFLADLKSMNYSSVGTADSKSMSYFLARTVDRDVMTPGYTDQ